MASCGKLPDRQSQQHIAGCAGLSGRRQHSLTQTQKSLLYAEPENGSGGKTCDQVSQKADAALQDFLYGDQAQDMKHGLVLEVEAVRQRACS